MVGIEEEFLLFRQDAPQLLDAGPPVVAAAERAATGDAQFEKELKAAQTELATQPGTDLAALAAELAERRSELATAAAGRGARVVASGTSPVGDRTRTTEDDRYRDMAETFGAIQRRQLTCAMHVHVGVDGDAEGVRVIDGIAPWLPVLVALSANSPFHAGEDTSYASFRRIQWGQWPSAGPTGPFGDVATYRRTVDALIASGAARDTGMIYFDARLSANYPTVEIRVCDVSRDVSTAVALAALCRGLVTTAATQEAPPPPRLELLRAAHWRAARYGTADQLVHEGRLVPAADAIGALIAFTEDALRAAGDLERVHDFVAAVAERGTGAERQRGAVAAAGGDLAAAVDATALPTD
jgi:carboxylate-amine ligase